MLKLSFWRTLAAIALALAVTACGGGSGSSAPAPSGFTVTPGNGQAIVTWTASPGVQYWLMYAQTATPIDMKNPPSNHVWATGITSPYVLTGLTNGVTYSFAMNARTDGGKGGDQTASKSVVPKYAGTTWSVASAISGSGDLHGLAYGTASDSTVDFVAVGNGGSIFKGTDGINWLPVTGGPTTDFTAALYAFSKFIAVGANQGANNIVSSADLSTWTTATWPAVVPARNLNALASNGTTVVAVGDAGVAFSSTNGITWTSVSTGVGSNLYGIAYSTSSGKWVAVGAGGVVITSADGSSWSAPVVSNTTADLRGVTATTGDVFVAVGVAGTTITSTGGSQWTAHLLPASSNLYAVSTDSAQFLAVGLAGAAYTSSDGATWVAVTTGSVSDLYAITGSTSNYVVVGKAGANISSK